MARITTTERTRIFGAPCTPSNHRNYLTPWGIRTVCHFLVLPRFAAACDLAKRASTWVPQRIDAYACRNIRESDDWSIHAWAMAWDFFATPPGMDPPGGVWTPDNPVPPEFAAAFGRFGFTCGRDFGRQDLPHIEWADGRPDPISAPSPQEDDDMTPEQDARLKAIAEEMGKLATVIRDPVDSIMTDVNALADEVGQLAIVIRDPHTGIAKRLDDLTELVRNIGRTDG